MKKVNWKSIIGWTVAALVAGFIVYSNMQEQKALQESGKKVVYAVLPLSGQIAKYGKDMQKTMEIYVQKNNPPFQIKFLDSAGVSATAVSALQQAALYDNNPIVISLPTHISSALAPIVEQKNGFLFGIATLAVTTDSKSFQRMSRCAKDEIGPLGDYILKHFKKIAVAYTQDDHGLKDYSYLKDALKGSNVQIVREVIVTSTERDVRNEAVKLISSKPEAVVVLGQAIQSYLNIIKELKRQDYQGQIMAECSFTNPPTFNALNGYTENVISSTMSVEIDMAQPKRIEELRTELNKDNVPTYFLTVEAIDTLDLIAYTINNNLPFSQKTYEQMKKWNGIAGDVIFTGNGDASVSSYQLAKVKNGKIVPVEK
ncbi:MAG: ABC transporter substrate-binding protein [Alphaproteobacteria bacterium]|nr:ABC transporter substrate-binding protein [Alphaproteobacteria bacterium]